MADLIPLEQVNEGLVGFGHNLEQLASMSRQGLPVAEAAAWPGAVFHRYVDKQQGSAHELGTLIRQAHRPGHRERCHWAEHLARQRPLHEALRAAANSFVEARTSQSSSKVLIWTSLVPSKRVLLNPTFRSLAPASAGVGALSDGLAAAFASAYDAELIRHAALARVKSYQIAVVLSLLPEGTPFELWLDVAPTKQESHFEAASQARGLSPTTQSPEPLEQTYWFVSKPAFQLPGALERAAFEALNTTMSGVREHLPETAAVVDVVRHFASAPAGGFAHQHDGDGVLVMSDRVSIIALNQAPAPVPRGEHWVALDDEFEVPCEVAQSLIYQLGEEVLRPLLDRLGGEPPRKAPLLEHLHGRPYLNVSTVKRALAKRLAHEGNFLEALTRPPGLGAAPSSPPPHGGDQHFVMPKLFARLAVSETKLRTAVREFENQARGRQRWLSEVDLAILPDDALRRALRENVSFFKHASRLYLQSKLSLLRALTAATRLASYSEGSRAPERVFSALRGIGDIPSAQLTFDAFELCRTLGGDAAALRAIRNGASEVKDLPPGMAASEIQRYLDRFGHWSLFGLDPSVPRLAERPRGLFACLAAMATDDQRWSPPSQGASEAARRHTAERIAAAAGWLEKRFIVALLARAANFIRIHEQLRVWLSRVVSMLRTVLLDADRRLQRQNSELPQGTIWHLSMLEIEEALLTGRADVLPLVCLRKAKRSEQLAALPHPRHLRSITAATPEWPGLARHLSGCFTGTGDAAGKVVHLQSLRKRAVPLSKQDVVVCRSVEPATALLLGRAGALIAERGNPLSHVAMVAREIGIPVVLGIGASARLLREGEPVFVDGARGTVERET